MESPEKRKFHLPSTLNSMKSSDPDHRYMALSDMINHLEKFKQISLDHSETKLYQQLYELLNYSNSPVQNLTIQSLKFLVKNNIFNKYQTITELINNISYNLLNLKAIGMSSAYGNNIGHAGSSKLSKANLDDFTATTDSLIEVSALALNTVCNGLIELYVDGKHKKRDNENLNILLFELGLGEFREKFQKT